MNLLCQLREQATELADAAVELGFLLETADAQTAAGQPVLGTEELARLTLKLARTQRVLAWATTRLRDRVGESEDTVTTRHGPTFVLRIAALPNSNGVPPESRLKRLLKVLLRGYGFRCVEVREEPVPAVNGEVSHGTEGGRL